MALGRLGRLTAILELNHAQFTAAVGRVEKQISGIQRSIQRASRTFGASLGAFGAFQLGREITQAGLAFERMDAALKTVFGSSQAAAREMEFIRKVSKDLGINLEQAAQGYVRLAASAQGSTLAGEETRKLFLSTAAASRALGLSADDTAGILRAFGQVISKDKVQAEELRGQIGERLPGAFQLAARAMGLTTAELSKMMERGEVFAGDLLPKMSREMDRVFSKGAVDASKKAAAQFERFKTTMLEMANALSGVLIPTLLGLAKVIGPIIEGWRLLIQEGPYLIRHFLGLNTAINEATNAFAALNQEQLTLKRNELEQQIADVEQRIVSLRDAMTEHPTGMATLLERLTGTGIAATRKELEQWQTTLSHLKTQLGFVDGALEKYTESTHTAGAASGEAREKVAKLDLTFRDLSSQVDDYKRRQERLRESIERLNFQGDRARELFGALGREADKTGGALSDLQLREANDRLRDMNGQVDEGTTLWRAFAEEIKSGREIAVEALRGIQDAFVQAFEDLFSGRALKSIKDFFETLKRIAIRVAAEIAAAWTFRKIFGGLLQGGVAESLFGGVAGGLGKAAGGAVEGGILKAIAGTKLGQAVVNIGKKIGAAFGIGAASSLTSAIPAAIGSVKGPAAFAAAASGGATGGAALGGLAFGAGALATLAAPFALRSIFGSKAGAAANQQFFSGVASGQISGEFTPLGDLAVFRGAIEDVNGALDQIWLTVDERIRPAFQALAQEGAITDIQNALGDELGQSLVRVTGDIDRVRAALSQAAIAGHSMTAELAQGAQDRVGPVFVHIAGNVNAIRDALQEAQAAGVGAFREIGETSDGLRVQLLDNFGAWKAYLDQQVRDSILGVIRGVDDFGRSVDQNTDILLQRGRESVNVLNQIAGAARSIPTQITTRHTTVQETVSRQITQGAGGGFQHGGAFMVRGPSGIDRVPVHFMASAGERVTVETREQQRRSAGHTGGGRSEALLAQLVREFRAMREELARGNRHALAGAHR